MVFIRKKWKRGAFRGKTRENERNRMQSDTLKRKEKEIERREKSGKKAGKNRLLIDKSSITDWILTLSMLY